MDARLTFDFTPKQAQATEAADTHQFTLFGGARGPGKSYWLRWWLLRFVMLCRASGLHHVVVGLFCEDYPSLKDRQISKIATEFPAWLGEVRDSQTHGFGFHLRDGDGTIALRNLDDPGKYQSSEFAAIGVDELTKNSLEKFNVLRGSLRWPGVRNTRLVAATNPGGVGHAWVKQYWIDRVYPPELQGMAHEFAFVPALPDDNPYLDPSYWHMLETLPEALAVAWRRGSWEVFEGKALAFDERHVCKPFPIPEHWRRWRAVDWGRVNPFCAGWLAKEPDTGRVYLYREAYETGLTDRQQARQIKALTPAKESIAYTLADPSMWTKKTFEERTFSTADEYGAEGVVLTRADNDRMTGKRKLDNMLEIADDGLPGFMVFDACPNTIRSLSTMIYDDHHREDVNSDGDDHPYDMIRYGLSRVNPRPARKAEAPPAWRADPVVQRALGRGMGSRDL